MLKTCVIQFILILGLSSYALAVAPEYSIVDKGVIIQGVDGTNPIIYDNDWWDDVFDNNYLWAQVHLGKADLRGNIVTRDMWDHPKYIYSMKKCVDNAHKALREAKDSGLKINQPITPGSDRVLTCPASGKIEDTKSYPTPGSRLIVQQAKKASSNKPLVIIAGGPLTTIANALLTNPEIADRIIVFALSIHSYAYNGKDGWSGYIVAKKTRMVEWATGSFWDKNSVFAPKHFENLPDNPFCKDMKCLINTELGQLNQLGDGAPLVWLYNTKCWNGAKIRKAVWNKKKVDFIEDKEGDILDIPKANTDLDESRKEFFRVISDTNLFNN